MPEDAPYDPAFDAEVVRLGHAGIGRREIASKLGLSPAGLDAMAAGRPSLAAALDRAEDEARAWWEALPREAISAGARFNLAAWREAARARFGELHAATEARPPPRRARFIFPWNERAPIGPDEFVVGGKDDPYARQAPPTEEED